MNIAGITHNKITDSEILSSYQCMVSEEELIPNAEVRKNFLHAIVIPFVLLHEPQPNTAQLEPNTTFIFLAKSRSYTDKNYGEI